MPTALIKTNGTIGSSYAGVIGTIVNLSNNNNTGVSAWTWTLTWKPKGSTAFLTTPTSQTSSFIPDVEGTYEYSLVVTGGSKDTQFCAVVTAHLLQRPPAGLETVGPADTTYGWAPDVNQYLQVMEKDIRIAKKVSVIVSTAFSGAGVGYVTGNGTLANGDSLHTVAPASATATGYLQNFGSLVWVTAATTINTKGDAVTYGPVATTLDTSGSYVGAPVYLGNSAGTISLSPGTVKAVVGTVETVASHGIIFFGNLPQYDVITGITALAGGGQSGATQLTGLMNVIGTVATANDSVLLLNAYPQSHQIVINSTADTVTIYPQSGQAIGKLGTNNPYYLPGYSIQEFFGQSISTWLYSGGGSASAIEVTATHPGSQSGVSAVLGLAVVTTATADHDSVTLVPGIVGVPFVVKNLTAFIIDVYPPSGGTINGGSANAQYFLQPYAAASFMPRNDAGSGLNTVSVP